jgi:5-methylthioadenosine/S-adenosylhomocysteine deaminase
MTDILILGGTVITMGPERQRIRDGAVAISGDTISKIGTVDEMGDLEADTVLEARGNLILPGFIDTHTHSQTSITALRGYGFELPWGGLYQRLMTIRVHVPEEERYYIAMNGCLSQLRFGTTTIADWDFGESVVAEVVRDLGIRGLLSEYVYGIDFHETRDAGTHVFSSSEADRTLEKGLQLIEDWHGAENGRIKCSLGPHAPDTCPPELLREILQEARQRNVRLNIHLAQSEGEVQIVRDLYDKSPSEYLLDEGILGPETSAAHCIYLDDAGIQTLRDTGTSICVSPRIYARRGGSTPLMKFLAAGCQVGLASDGDPEIIRNMEMARVAAGFRDSFLGEGPAPDSQRLLELATIDAARVLGLEDSVGSLEVGKKADVILVDMQRPHLIPNIDPVANLVYYGNGSDVKTVIIDGRVVVQDRQITTVDEESMLQHSEEAALNIWERYTGERPG